MRIGDVSSDPRWFLADETINAMLGQYSFDEACAQCAESIGAQLIQMATSVEQRNLKVQYQERSKAAFDLADRIRNLAQPGPGDPVNYGSYAGQMESPSLCGYLSDVPRCPPGCGNGSY